MSSIDPNDRVAILDLVSAYSYTYDAKDLDAFIELFTRDLEWEAYLDKGNTVLVKFPNRAAFALFSKERLEANAAAGINSRHYQTNTVLTEVDADHVDGVTMIVITWHYTTAEKPVLDGQGVYRDTFERTREGWKIRKRTLLYDTPSTVADRALLGP